jgi:hypothetical protein
MKRLSDGWAQGDTRSPTRISKPMYPGSDIDLEFHRGTVAIKTRKRACFILYFLRSPSVAVTNSFHEEVSLSSV